MTVRDIDLAIRPVASRVGKHERRDPRRVGLKGQHDHVAQQSDMFGILVRYARRCRVVGVRIDIRVGFRSFDPPFDFADPGEILIELSLIVAAQS